jgi:hypothetical protein
MTFTSTRGGHRRAHWLLPKLAAALVAGVLGAVAGHAPASAASPVIPPSSPCYFNLCLDYNPQDGSLTAWEAFYDVGPTPYYISIFNETTGERLAVCGFGTSCTSGPYHGPPLNECYDYVAYIAGYPSMLPPPSIQRTSETITECNYLH